MRRPFILAIIALCCTAMPLLAEPLSPVDFPFCADVQGAFKTGSLYQVHLGDEVIQKAGSGLPDLRLFDTSGKETPLVVIRNAPPHETVETYPLEITGYDHDASSAVIIMKLPQKHRPISILDLETPDRDFKKRVVLEASSDNRTWKPVTEDTIYDFSSQVNVRKTRLEFVPVDARYFRLSVMDVKPQSADQPSIKLKYEGLDFCVNGVKKNELRIHAVHGSTGMPVEKRPVYDQRTFTDLSPSQDKDGNTVILLPADLPVDKLTLEVANPYYYRTVYLYGSSTGKDDSWQFLLSEVIYRFPLLSEQHEERNILEHHVPKHAYYKLVVMNKNNPPLVIKTVSLAWVQQNLYFIALANSERYTLCFGNARVKRPDYDIARFVNQDTLSQHSFERVALSALHAGSGPRLTFEERLAGAEKLILKIVVVLLVIGMGFWLYTLLKKTPEKK
jgi:hypothetical protein